MINAKFGHISSSFPETLNDVPGALLIKLFRLGHQFKNDDWQFRKVIFHKLLEKKYNARFWFWWNETAIPFLDKITFKKLPLKSSHLGIEEYSDLILLSTNFLVEIENNLTAQLFSKLKIGFWQLSGIESNFTNLDYKSWILAEEQNMIYGLNRNQVHLHKLFATLWRPTGIFKIVFQNNFGAWGPNNQKSIEIVSRLSAEHKQIMLLWYASCNKKMKDKFHFTFPKRSSEATEPIQYSYTDIKNYIETFMRKVTDYAPSPKSDDIDGVMNGNVWNVLSFIEKDLQEYDLLKSKQK